MKFVPFSLPLGGVIVKPEHPPKAGAPIIGVTKLLAHGVKVD